MEDLVVIKAESRKEVGKKIAKKLRTSGKIPAIIYGLDKESIPISLWLEDVKNILRMEKGRNTILRIDRDKDIHVDAMLKELQYDYLGDNVIHADFIRIDLNKPIDVSVPVHVTGEAIGVKVEDGLFDFMTRAISVRCLPRSIPKGIQIDVSEMHAGDSIKVEDLEAGEGIEYTSDPHTVICAVVSKRAAEEAEVPEEEEGAEEAATEEVSEGKGEEQTDTQS